MTDPDLALRNQLRNIEQATGRTLTDWAKIVDAAGLTQHGQIVTYLKTDRGFTHGNANTLARKIREQVSDHAPTDDELLDAQYSGNKAALRPIYDELILLARALGSDVTVSMKKTGVSLRRKKQFALIRVPSAKRVELGFNLRDAATTPRLRTMTGMCTHAVDLTDPDDIDDQVVSWLRTAYNDG